jgi:K+-sensing histidine kinase KdpD
MNKKLEKLNFETLLDISFRLNSNVKLDELAEYLVFTLIGLFGIDEIQLLVPFDYLKKRQLVRIFPFDEKIIEFEENVFEKIMKGNLIFDSGIIKKICFSLENTYNNPNNFYLVWPLITNSQLSGVLILSKPLFETENNLNNMDENSFIKILSAQMAIAIQNAKFIREREKYNEFLVKSEKISTIGVLASSVAHDINNPLLCIMGYIRILEKKLDSPEIREYLSIIKNEINSCKRITQNLLDYSRNQRVTGESSDLIEILEKVVGLIRYECKKAKINLIFENEIYV